MYITRETKERFVKMLNDRQILVIQNDKGRKYKTYNLKFIGANSDGKWDFTPMVAQLSKYQSTKEEYIQYISIRALDAVAVICNVLDELKDEGIVERKSEGFSQYEEVRDKISTFYV